MRRRRRTAVNEAERSRRHQRKGDEVNAVVLEDGLERMRLPVADESEIPRRNLESRHIADAVIARQMTFEDREPATVVIERWARNDGTLLPQSTGRMKHVEMRQIRERERQPVQQIASLDQRGIERSAVEADKRALSRRELGDPGEQGALMLEAGKKKLSYAKPAVLENRAADEKRLCACPTRQPRGFNVEETQAGRIRVLQREPATRSTECASASLSILDGFDDLADRLTPMATIGPVITIDDNHRAVWRLEPLPGKDVGHARAVDLQRRHARDRWRGCSRATRRHGIYLAPGAIHNLSETIAQVDRHG